MVNSCTWLHRGAEPSSKCPQANHANVEFQSMNSVMRCEFDSVMTSNHSSVSRFWMDNSWLIACGICSHLKNIWTWLNVSPFSGTLLACRIVKNPRSNIFITIFIMFTRGIYVKFHIPLRNQTLQSIIIYHGHVG